MAQVCKSFRVQRSECALSLKAYMNCDESGIREEPFATDDLERRFNFPKGNESGVEGTGEPFSSFDGRSKIELDRSTLKAEYDA